MYPASSSASCEPLPPSARPTPRTARRGRRRCPLRRDQPRSRSSPKGIRRASTKPTVAAARPRNRAAGGNGRRGGTRALLGDHVALRAEASVASAAGAGPAGVPRRGNSLRRWRTLFSSWWRPVESASGCDNWRCAIETINAQCARRSRSCCFGAVAGTIKLTIMINYLAAVTFFSTSNPISPRGRRPRVSSMKSAGP